jgi:hypothetical protein
VAALACGAGRPGGAGAGCGGACTAAISGAFATGNAEKSAGGDGTNSDAIDEFWTEGGASGGTDEGPVAGAAGTAGTPWLEAFATVASDCGNDEAIDVMVVDNDSRTEFQTIWLMTDDVASTAAVVGAEGG